PLPPTFLFTHTSPTEIYTLSLHDALPIYRRQKGGKRLPGTGRREEQGAPPRKDRRPSERLRPGGTGKGGLEPVPYRRLECAGWGDRKSTRLNSSHVAISYAVFCLKKKKKR